MFSNQYIKMCIEAKDEIEYIRISREFQRGNEVPKFSFKRGDYFHHPEMESDEAQEIIRVEGRNLQGSDAKPCEREKCIWTPTPDQLVDELGDINFFFSIEVARDYYAEHVLSGLSDEERVLAYYMEIHEKKWWDIENQNWDQIREEGAGEK